ncbi:MAG: hypothetical protein ACXWBO_14700 [Ilumatobacteraceae bacterium]
MSLLIALLTVVTLGLAVGAAPFLLSWPHHLRWMIATNATAYPFRPAAIFDSILLSEVTVVATDAQPGQVVTRLATGSNGELIMRSALSTEAIARLERWATDGTPLLLVSSVDGSRALHSRTACVLGLRDWEPRPGLKAA